MGEVSQAFFFHSFLQTNRTNDNKDKLQHWTELMMVPVSLKTNPTRKVSFSAARRQYLRECFEEIIDVAASQPDVHHKRAAILVKFKKVGGDIGKNKKK